MVESNKAVYGQLVAEFYLNQQAKTMLLALQTGFYSVVGVQTLQVFESDELAFVLQGANQICLQDWKQNTRYTHNLVQEQQEKKVVHWFWTQMNSLSQVQLRKFLFFATGVSSVPIDGFKGLTTQRGDHAPFTITFSVQPRKMKQDRFKLSRGGTIRAFTCFNRIELPMFQNEKECGHNI